MRQRHVIIAPHPDDELIGCYRLLVQGWVDEVIYYRDFDNPDRRNEARNLCLYYGVKAIFCEGVLGELILRISERDGDRFCIPSPNDEHNDHKMIYYLVKELDPLHLAVYSVYMRDFFVQTLPLKDQEHKEELLNKFYPSQRALWQNDKRFLLFEGLVTL